MKDLLKNFTRDNIIGGIVCVVIGLLFIIMPGSLANIMVIISGILLILGAVGCLFLFLRESSSISIYGLAGAIVLTIVGIYTLTHVYMIKGVLNTFFGIVIICFGSIFVARSIDVLRRGGPDWLPQLIIAGITVTIGTIILFGRFSTIFKITGIGLVIAGALIIVMTLLFGRKVNKAVKKNSPMDTDWHEVDQ